MSTTGQENNSYEAERAKRIAENRAKLSALGLVGASRALAMATATTTTAFTAEAVSLPPLPSHSTGARPRSKVRRKPKSSPTPSMRERSKRLRGVQAAATEQDEDNSSSSTLETEPKTTTKSNMYTTKRTKALELPENTIITPPFTLRATATTVWDLGTIHRGPWAQRYWSNKGCLYHHAYPIGYRATKEVFGKQYEMRIEAGEAGPVFSVRLPSSTLLFTGTSPTKPWTDVCIHHKTGQRISGPLFFGFSDAITQQAIAMCCYSPRELAAALAGETVECEELSAEEVAAKEFVREVVGVGETTGMALARTVALGGRRHTGVASLRSWVQEDVEGNGKRLLDFLLESQEVPEATRKWGAWRGRIAPKIVHHFSSSSFTSTTSATTTVE